MRRKIWLSTVTSFAAKTVSVVATALVVPMAHNGLSPNAFGVWMTLTSLLLILQFADLGIGNGLVNVVGMLQAAARRRDVATAVSTAFAMMTAVAAALALIIALMVPLVDWNGLLGLGTNGDEGVRTAVLLFALCIAVSIPMTVGQKILWAHQEMYLANLWQIGGSVIQICLVAAAVRARLGLWAVAAAVPLGQLLALSGATVEQLYWRRPWLRSSSRRPKLGMARRLVANSGPWILYQAIFFAATSIDGVFVTWRFGAQAMGSYGLMMRLAAGLSVALFFTVPLWPAFSEGLARRDDQWVVRTFYRALALCFAIGTGGSLLILFTSQLIARIWVGPDVIPPVQLIYAFASWFFVYNVWCGVSALLGTEPMVGGLVLAAALGGALSLSLKIPLANALGPAGICWASTLGIGFASVVGMFIVATVMRRRRHIASRDSMVRS